MRVVASREEAWVVARKEDAGVAGMAVEGAMLAMVMPEERVVRDARQAADCIAARRVERTVVAARAASMAMVAVPVAKGAASEAEERGAMVELVVSRAPAAKLVGKAKLAGTRRRTGRSRRTCRRCTCPAR